MRSSILLTALLVTLGSPAIAEPPHAVVIKAGRLFSGVGDDYRRNVVIVVEGDRIKSVGPAAEATIPAGATTIDLSSAVVLPG